MAVKFKISKEDFDKLPADVQKEYKASGDDYVLDVTGLEDSPMGRARDHEKQKRKELQSKYEEELAAHESTKSDFEEFKKDKPDVANLEKKYQDKIAKMETDHATALEGKDATINKLMVDDVANSMAARISKAPKLLAPIIAKQLGVHTDDKGVATTRVLDEDGEFGPTTLEELENTIKADKEYADIIIGSQGSGGGANGNNGKGGQGGGGIEKPDFLTATPKQMAAYLASTEEGEE